MLRRILTLGIVALFAKAPPSVRLEPLAILWEPRGERQAGRRDRYHVLTMRSMRAQSIGESPGTSGSDMEDRGIMG